MTRRFGALTHWNYRLYFAGQSISLIGTWMQTVGQAWLVLKLTNSATDLGIVSALQLLPMLVMGWVGGAVADRVPKRRLIICTQSTAMLLAFALGTLVVTNTVQIWHVYVLATFLGINNAFDIPTRQAFAIEMVGRDDLMNAVALTSIMFNSARIIGPAVAGVLIGLVGVTSSFFMNGISFMFVIAGLLFMQPSRFYEVEAAPRMPMHRSLAEGFRYVRRDPAIRTVIVLVGVYTLFATNTNVLVPLFAQNVLNVGATGLGVLFSAMGIGSVGMGLIIAMRQRASWSWILVGAVCLAATQIAIAISRNYPLSIGLFVLLGIGSTAMTTSTNTSVQHRVPDRLRGRVMGIYMTVNQGSQPFGNLAAGALAAAFGAPVAMAAGAGAALAGLVTVGGWMAAHRRTVDLGLEPAPDIPLNELIEAVPAG